MKCFILITLVKKKDEMQLLQFYNGHPFSLLHCFESSLGKVVCN